MTAEEEADVRKYAGATSSKSPSPPTRSSCSSTNNPVEGITLPQLDALYGTNRLAGYKKSITTWSDLGVKGELADVKVKPYGILEEKNWTVRHSDESSCATAR